MRATLEGWWERSTSLQRMLLVGVPAVVIALGAVGVMYASFSGGDDGDKQVIAPTATRAVPTAIPATATAEPTATATPEPVVESDTSGDYDYSADYSDYSEPVEDAGPQGGSQLNPNATEYGPGGIYGTDMTIVIPSIGVNLAVSSRTVGTGGQMGDPSGAFQVIWYDFSQAFVGVGGYPGQPGANVVMAAHVDYIGVGPAAFYSVPDLQPGDIVTVYTSTEAINYSIQWSQWIDPYADFSSYVNSTGAESITLITCVGGFSAGHYSNRIAVRGVRI